jgi:hypothetical protein
MKKYVLLYCGIERSEQSQAAWGAWFTENGAVFIDGGNPFGGGRWVTADGASDLPDGPDAINAYSIVSVADAAAAEALAASCPAVAGVRVYEALPM